MQLSRNFWARSAEEEDAAATTSCLTSETLRVEGSMRRSFVKADGERTSTGVAFGKGILTLCDPSRRYGMLVDL